MKNNRNDTRFLSLSYEDEGCGGGLGSSFLFSQISRMFYSIATNTLFVLFCSERKLGKTAKLCTQARIDRSLL